MKIEYRDFRSGNRQEAGWNRMMENRIIDMFEHPAKCFIMIKNVLAL
jgi:hypothetical protein